jgi:hypothetical protein
MEAGTCIDYKSVTVGGIEYKLIPLAATQAIDFCTDASISLAPLLANVEIGDGGMGEFVMRVIPNIGLLNADKTKAMFKVVREQAILPNGKRASDALAFIEWFKDHPSHMMELHVRALFLLVADFFPKELGTILAGTSLRKS